MHTRHRRPGFTLTELLVAMTIMLVLGTVVVGFLPSLKHQERAARGGDLLQRWLLIARQRALSDRTPTGLRLIVDPVDGNVRELHYIGVPEDFTQGQFTGGPNPSNFTFSAGETDFLGNGTFAATDPDAPVQIGDYLEVYGGGLLTQITGVASNALNTVSNTPTLAGISTNNYRIIRQPRRLKGENPLLMPQDIAIELSRCRTGGAVGVPSRQVGTTTYHEILFAPSGGVIGRGTTGDKIIFFVRDITRDNEKDGSPSLIVVHVRTGLIAAHPLDLTNPPTSYYDLTKGWQASGM